MSLREGNFFLQVQGLIARRKFLLARCKDSLREGNFFLQVQGLVARWKFLLARCKDSLRGVNFFLQVQGLVARRKYLLAGARTHCVVKMSSPIYWRGQIGPICLRRRTFLLGLQMTTHLLKVLLVQSFVF